MLDQHQCLQVRGVPLLNDNGYWFSIAERTCGNGFCESCALGHHALDLSYLLRSFDVLSRLFLLRFTHCSPLIAS